MADLPSGVELRGQSIRIWFMYKGKRCRELLKGWLPTLANIKKAGQLRMVIVSEISLGEFNYRSRFPDSTKADETTGTVQLRFSANSSIPGWLTVKSNFAPTHFAKRHHS